MRDISGKINIIVVLVILFVMLGAGGAYFWFFLRDPVEVPASLSLSTISNPVAETAPETTPATNNKSTSSTSPTTPTPTGSGAMDYIKDYAIFTLGDIVVNPRDAEKNTYLITSISFAYRLSDKNMPVELKNKTPIFRDSILSYFSRCTLVDLRDIEKRDTFKEDIMRMVNESLLEGRITNVLFEQFVIQ